MVNILSDRTSIVEIEKRSFRVANFRGQSLTLCLVGPSIAETDLNGATLNYYLIGYRDEKKKAIMDLLKIEFRSRAYKYLRTEN